MIKFDPKITALKLALNKMFKGNYFNISVIESCLKLTNSIPDPDIYIIMQTVHCVHFTDMDKNFRDFLYKETILMMNFNGFDFIDSDNFDNRKSIEVCENYTILE